MTAPNSTTEAGVTDADDLDSLIRLAGNLAVMHAEYMGKAMPDDVYYRFTTLRDERMPELRDKLRAALAQSRASAQGGERVEPVAEIVNKFGDPEAFAERELRTLTDIQKLPIGTKLVVVTGAADGMTEKEIILFCATLEGFADCGETETDYEVLVDWAKRGFLECTNFVPTAAGHRIAAIRAGRKEASRSTSPAHPTDPLEAA